MPPISIRVPPNLEDYTPLAEHQSQTPATFYGGKPILHYHGAGAKAWIPATQVGSLAIFPRDSTTAPTEPELLALAEDSEELREQKVDIFVTSELVQMPFLFSMELNTEILACLTQVCCNPTETSHSSPLLPASASASHTRR